MKVNYAVPDPGRVLRRRRSPLQLALGGVLVVLILVVEVMILQAYANVNRTTAIFGEQSFLNSTLVNAQREAMLLEDQIQELPTSGDLKGVTIRRGLLGTQLFQAEGHTGDPKVAHTLEQARRDLALIDRHLARIKADPERVSMRAEVAVMQPAAHRLAVSIKQLFDTKEQELFGAVNGALDARRSSERLLVGLSAMVLVVGLALSLSLRQRVRKDFARAYEALTAEVDERKAAERALFPLDRFRSLSILSTCPHLDADGPSATTASRSAVCSLLPAAGRRRPPLPGHPDDARALGPFVAEYVPAPGVTAAETCGPHPTAPCCTRNRRRQPDRGRQRARVFPTPRRLRRRSWSPARPPGLPRRLTGLATDPVRRAGRAALARSTGRCRAVHRPDDFSTSTTASPRPATAAVVRGPRLRAAAAHDTAARLAGRVRRAAGAGHRRRRGRGSRPAPPNPPPAVRRNGRTIRSRPPGAASPVRRRRREERLRTAYGPCTRPRPGARPLRAVPPA